MQDAGVAQIKECSTLCMEGKSKITSLSLEFLKNNRIVTEKICLRKEVYCRRREMNVQNDRGVNQSSVFRKEQVIQ